MKLLSLATALLGFAAFVSAQEVDKRLIDISETELQVTEVHKPNLDTFIVTVQRKDDLLADDGTFLAERDMSVAFNFDVQNHELFLNNVPLSLEDSEEPITLTVDIEAGLIVGPAIDPETNPEELLSFFDPGLVKVEVTASTEFATLEDGTVVRRVTLQETIIEVNGQEIEQTEAVQQIFEIMPDGTLGNYTPLKGGRCQSGKDFEAFMKSVDEWFSSLNWPVLAIVGLVASGMFVASATSLRSLVKKRREARLAQYAQLQQQDEEYVQVAIMDDKKAGLDEDDEKKPLTSQ
ncbi:hypothetical protein BGW38_004496 [Lunasporangiospora selenospora]|uniref:Uncharacterized protein n=1 Tax=Lunasporangiospora selenospora TaxID=979761 RepID=A0A9P6FP93_9FUNG|nr:hypothetical protein BGW38_004496 [Lunasporangiospora selenospora]